MATKILHLDASSGVTSSGGLVSQWDDISGNGYNVVQSNATLKPLLVTGATSNGLSAIRFAGGTNGGDYLRNVAFGTTYNQPYTFFVVLKRNTVGETDSILSLYPNANTDLLFSSTNYLRTRFPATTNDKTGSLSVSQTTNFFIVTCKVTSTSVTTWVNKQIDYIDTTGVGTCVLSGITIGASYVASYGLDADVAEVLVVANLADGEEKIYQQYFNEKYELKLNVSVDFITLEEEQLYPVRTDEVSVDFVTLEEEQLPLQIPEELQEFSVTEQDLDFTTLEMSLIEKDPLEDTPIFNEIILGESLDPFTIPEPVKVVIHTNGGTMGILGKLF